jgi:hypothetical protein
VTTPETPTSLGIIVPTSNRGKIDRLKQVTNLPIQAAEPLFDEDQIKSEVAKEDGINYVSAISRKKLERHRALAREEEGSFPDYAIITSDSIILVNDEGKETPLNRDGLTDEEKQTALEAINKSKEITFIGAVSFGRKNGQSAFTVTTFFAMPLGEPLTDLPVQIDELPDKKDPDRKIKYGYIQHLVDNNGGLVTKKKILGRTDDFSEARPYISGLTSEIINFANDTAFLDKLTAAATEDLVEKSSFNTVAFYSLAKQMGVETPRDFQKFYESIANSGIDFFNTQGGGNCALFSLELVKRLRELGLDPQIASYESLNFGNSTPLEDGHSGVLIKFNGRDYLFDPGLSISFPIPVGKIPISPFYAGGAKSFVVTVNDSSPVPHLYTLKPDATYRKIAGHKVQTPEQFQDRLPKILGHLHDERVKLKIDYHDKSGKKILGFSVDRSTNQVTMKIDGADEPISVSLSELFSDTNTTRLSNIEQFCSNFNIDSSVVMRQLRVLAAQ